MCQSRVHRPGAWVRRRKCGEMYPKVAPHFSTCCWPESLASELCSSVLETKSRSDLIWTVVGLGGECKFLPILSLPWDDFPCQSPESNCPRIAHQVVIFLVNHGMAEDCCKRLQRVARIISLDNEGFVAESLEIREKRSKRLTLPLAHPL